MRVIEQLIHHFWDRGQISREQIDRLIALGFVASGELAGYWPEFTEPEVVREEAEERAEYEAQQSDVIADELIAHSSDKPRGLRVPGRRWGRRARRRRR